MAISSSPSCNPALAAGLPGSTVYRQSVLATRLESYGPVRARVSVWVLATVGQSGGRAGARVNPVASFATFTLELAWERAAWRLDGTGQRPGRPRGFGAGTGGSSPTQD